MARKRRGLERRIIFLDKIADSWHNFNKESVRPDGLFSRNAFNNQIINGFWGNTHISYERRLTRKL